MCFLYFITYTKYAQVLFKQRSSEQDRLFYTEILCWYNLTFTGGFGEIPHWPYLAEVLFCPNYASLSPGLPKERQWPCGGSGTDLCNGLIRS